jgi:pimeloyl-ACP methyl ester carboxylesterase
MREAPHPKAPRLAPDDHGLLWVTAKDFQDAIAPDTAADRCALLAAAQKPIAAACLGEKLVGAAWRERPSWFLVAEHDRMVAPSTQQFLASRMKSRVVSLASDHFPLASHADVVADAFVRAATLE